MDKSKGATLFKGSCQNCHTQGPSLAYYSGVKSASLLEPSNPDRVARKCGLFSCFRAIARGKAQKNSFAIGSIPNLARPVFIPVATKTPPKMPAEFTMTALLHPFAPSPNTTCNAGVDSLFYQICIATLYYTEHGLDIQIVGIANGLVCGWFKILKGSQAAQMKLSSDGGRTWTDWMDRDLGWVYPTSWFSLEANASIEAVGVSPLNWLQPAAVTWWKQATPVPNSKTRGSTWFWFDGDEPRRWMYGVAPASDSMGDKRRFPLLQNFSFTYVSDYKPSGSTPREFQTPNVIGLKVKPSVPFFTWPENFAMTTWMTPIDFASNPMPTQVCYTWSPDESYTMLTDRTQVTDMSYKYNPHSPLESQTAYLYGASPENSAQEAGAGTGIIYSKQKEPSTLNSECVRMPLGQQPPSWISAPGVEGRCWLSIQDHPLLAPNVEVCVFSVLFPATERFAQGHYLFTYYVSERPVCFMESASTIDEGGTSLSLADYFAHEVYEEKIDESICLLPKGSKLTQSKLYMGHGCMVRSETSVARCTTCDDIETTDDSEETDRRQSDCSATSYEEIVNSNSEGNDAA